MTFHQAALHLIAVFSNNEIEVQLHFHRHNVPLYSVPLRRVRVHVRAYFNRYRMNKFVQRIVFLLLKKDLDISNTDVMCRKPYEI